jgi:HNH endonuclease
MSAIKQRKDSIGGALPEESGEYVRVPAVIDARGDKIVTIIDAHGRPQTRLIAELVLEAFRGPCPPGQTLKFKDGNRLNCELTNLEWAPAPAICDEAAKAKAIATRERADAVRQSLAGRHHSDSAELVSEDRKR